jgi:ATP phosphoribosyltransferase regulatory subunit
MMHTVAAAGITGVSLDIGHVAIFRSLVRRGQVPDEAEAEMFRAMQAKDVPALRALTRRIERRVREALVALPELYGGAEVLRLAWQRLPPYPELRAALRTLRVLSLRLADVARIRCFDLAELRGYRYHSGVVFAAYAAGHANALAVGGRYDEVGKAFGRARPATGFSMDLRELAAAGPGEPVRGAIRAPYRPRNVMLRRRIGGLRRRGEIVAEDLPGHASTRDDDGCDRRLVLHDGKWIVQRLKP